MHFENLANLPFCSQVGERDDTVRQRAKVVVGANDELDKLEADTPCHYYHDCFVHANGTHNSCERAEDSTAESTVFTNPHSWFEGLLGGGLAESKNTNAIKWMSQWYPRSRDPIPSLVVWNLESRPPPPSPRPADWQEKRFFYWLYLRKPAPTDP